VSSCAAILGLGAGFDHRDRAIQEGGQRTTVNQRQASAKETTLSFYLRR
jgi:hypothetical protein